MSHEIRWSGTHYNVTRASLVLLFGDQWTAVPLIFRVLAVGGVFQIFTYTSYWVFLAKGLTNRNLRYALFSRVIVIAAVCIGSFWGYVGVAAGYSLSMIICWPLCQWWTGRKVSLPQRQLFGVGSRALLVATGGVLLGLLALRTVPEAGGFQLVVGAVATLSGVALVGVSLRPFRADFGTVFRGLQLMRRKN